MPIGDPERWNCVVLNVLCRLSFRRVSSSGWKKEGKERERERGWKKKRREEEGAGKVRTAQMGWRWRWWRWWLAVAKAMPLVAVTWLPGPYLCHRTSNATPNPTPPRTSFHVLLYFLQARRRGFLLYHSLILLSRVHIFRDRSSYFRPWSSFHLPCILLITFLNYPIDGSHAWIYVKWLDTFFATIPFSTLKMRPHIRPPINGF